MAKPKLLLTENEKKLILALYEIGKTDNEIANILHLPQNTFRDALKYNDLTASIKSCKGVADSKVEYALYQQALNGNVTAQIFWLCNRQKEKWQNVNKIDHNIGGKGFDTILDSIKQAIETKSKLNEKNS